MEIYYGFVKNRSTGIIMGASRAVGVAGTIDGRGNVRYVALNVATTEKKFRTQLDALAGRAKGDFKITKKEGPIRPLLAEVRSYFSGETKQFSHEPLHLTGTDFQKKVWKALRKVPYGKTESYGGIARKIKKPGAARAVGMANNANPVSLVVPCHRIVGSGGALVGYGGGGVKVKRNLLRLEGGL